MTATHERKRQQLQKYERGANRVDAGRLVRIAAALDVPVTALLHGVAPGQRPAVLAALPAASPLKLIAERQPFRLVQSFARIEDRAVRRSLVTLVEEIARQHAGGRGRKG